MSYPLDLDPEAVDSLGRRAVGFVADYLRGLPIEPVSNFADPTRLVTHVLRSPPEKPGDLDDLLAAVGEAAGYGLNPAAGGYLAYFPAGGLPSSVVAQILNRYTGFGALAPGLVAMAGLDAAQIRVVATRPDMRMDPEAAARPGVSEAKTPLIRSGGTESVTVTLRKGTYELWCSVGNHREQGMELTLSVGGAATPSPAPTGDGGGY